MDAITQPTQQSTQATQKYIIDKFSQEKIADDIVCRLISTTGELPIKDLRADLQEVLKTKKSIKKEWICGRNANSCDFYLGDHRATLSNKHFIIWLGEDGNLLLKDISTNGTWINGIRMHKNQNYTLSQGDEISVGVNKAEDTLSFIVFIHEAYKKQLKRMELELLRNKNKINNNINTNTNNIATTTTTTTTTSTTPTAITNNNTTNDNNTKDIYHNYTNNSDNIKDIKKRNNSKPNTVYNNHLAIDEQLCGINKDFSIQDEVVGQGAFATVKKAIDRSTGKTYAVKIINKKKMATTELEGAARELDILQRLEHPRVVSLKAFYEDSNNYYLVMEFVSGGDLMDFVAAHGPINEDASREIIKQILEAIDYIHSKGISHRDLKPDNVLIEQDSPVLVKLTDFGLAKVQGNGTFMKTFCGTLAYIAPEVISEHQKSQKRRKNKLRLTNLHKLNAQKPGHNGGTHVADDENENEDKDEDEDEDEDEIKYSSLVDMWSMGCLAYVILTGHLPFSGASQKELFLQIKKGTYHGGPLKGSGVSEEAIDFINNLLQVDPEKRYTAKKALNHPWIKAAYKYYQESMSSGSLGSLASIISLSQSQYHNNAINEASEENIFKKEDEICLENEEDKFKVPNFLPKRFMQPQILTSNAIEHANNKNGDAFNPERDTGTNNGKRKYDDMKQEEEIYNNDNNNSNRANTTTTANINSICANATAINGKRIIINSLIGEGRFLTLSSTVESIYNADLAIPQGISKGVFIGRDPAACDFFIKEYRLSKVHCMIFKRRHVIERHLLESNITNASTNTTTVITNSQNVTEKLVSESPAQGLEDIWFYSYGQNPCYVNDTIIKAGFKTKIYHGDIIKLFSDNSNGKGSPPMFIGFRVDINDDTGLFNKGLRHDVYNYNDVIVEEQNDVERKVPKKLLTEIKRRNINNCTHNASNKQKIKKVSGVLSQLKMKE
ncbi:serine/threonine/tyrosine protein kinase RAD53 SCDLUD_002158 [Saccharomycodes ludwigii]|uniref:serine/threonine/tyrosine protein kinase RAD53 n=1 Tax=Saccharomycodes ludwigii TaxID=36035 RepID=UPI001E8BB985|nr:hypothetical protein SCDLUD_002158 [Saccharomycodes ludwigii]KAH3902338.1 hypothetical protein SCDLUD_002158 [Saccharomycodes ludwigii]